MHAMQRGLDRARRSVTLPCVLACLCCLAVTGNARHGLFDLGFVEPENTLAVLPHWRPTSEPSSRATLASNQPQKHQSQLPQEAASGSTDSYHETHVTGQGFTSHVYRARTQPDQRRVLPETSGTDGGGHVAINFFGLTRSLHHTIDSIEEYLLMPIREAGYKIDIFVHTYDLSVLTSVITAGERGQRLNSSEWRLLKPLAAEITSQEQFLDAYGPELERCRHSGRPEGHTGWEESSDPEGANWTNMACQLHSQSRVSRLWQAEHAVKNYSAVIYARPDVLYNCYFPVEHLLDIQPNTVYLPDWEHAKGYNDRFSLSVPQVAEQLGNRLFFTLGTCGSLPVHSEQYNKRFITVNNLDVVKMKKFRFYRVRANGAVATRDEKILLPCNRESFILATGRDL